jgi:hypothetical protein
MADSNFFNNGSFRESFMGHPMISGTSGHPQGIFGHVQEALFGSPVNAVGGPEDITNVNPYTDAFYQQLQGVGNNTYNQLQQSLGGQNQFYPGMQDFMGNMNPNAAYNYFANNMAGGLRGVAEQNFDAYNTANQAVADRMSNQAVQNIASQFANRGPGALRSGGAMQAIGEGAINPLLQSNAQIAQMIGGQAGQLQGQGMGQAYGAHNLGNQLGMQGWGALMGSADQRAMADQSLLGNMWGTAIGQQGQIADPWLYQQQYMNNPNYLSLGNLLNAGAQISGGMVGAGGGGGGV